MKKFASIALRLITAVAIFISGFLLLESPVTIEVSNVQKMAKVVINKNVDQTNDSNLMGALKFAKDFGIEDKVLQQLPQKYHRDLSYVNMYDLSVTYQENGELSAKNLNLPEKNQVQRAFNYIVVNKINENLKQNAKQVNNLTNIFHYFLFGAVLLFFLAILLVLFGKYWASIALLIASVGSFVVMQFYLNQVVQNLQTELYQGISLSTSMGLWIGLAAGVIAAVIWPFILKLFKSNN